MIEKLKLSPAVLVVIASLSGCGSTIEVKGIKDINVNLNLSNLLPYVTAYCKETVKSQVPDTDESYDGLVEACANLEIGKLINKL